MSAYYNEIDPYAAQWLRNLIAAGHIAPGEVDERSIEDVRPDDLREFTQCHFFAGIGVWSYALRQAGWPDDRPVWTGSCPCQPFSQAGEGVGFADERHLWPSFEWLIGQRRPPVIFGEQVASKAVGPWIDLVHADVEAMGYAFGAVAFPSAGVGAPHIRDRLFWVADMHDDRRESGREVRSVRQESYFEHGRAVGQLGDTYHARLEIGRIRPDEQPGAQGRKTAKRSTGLPSISDVAREVNGLWAGADWISCRDNKWRPIEPGLEPLVNGTPGRVGRLRAYGNAINAQAAKEFIAAYIDAPVSG